MQDIRTFVAVTVQSKLEAAIEKRLQPIQHDSGEVRWTRKEQYHFTLAFLGDLDSRQLKAIFEAAGQAAKRHPAFDVDLVGVGGFPNLERASTLWIGVDEGREELKALQASLSEALEPLGFRPEYRPYSPHMTIGRLVRFKRPSPDLVARLENLAEFDFGTMAVDAIRVMRSDLDRSGPTYSVMATYPLSKESKL